MLKLYILIAILASVNFSHSVCPATRKPVKSPEVTSNESSNESSSTEDTFSDDEKAESIALLESGVISFSGEFLYKMLLDNPNKNFVTSAYSLFIPFGQLGLFSTGTVLDQLLAALNLRNKTDIEAAFPPAVKSDHEQQSVTFDLATKIYANQNYEFTANFINKSLDIFDATEEITDFGDPEQAANIINSWVAENTNDRIQNLVSADMFDESTVMALVDAIYFKGAWQTKFNPNDTIDRDFYVSETKTIQIPTMYQKSTSMRYGEDEDIDAQIIDIPYTGGNFSCGVILPRNISGLLSAVEKLANPDKFTDVFNSLSYETVYIYLPKMQISTRINLPDILTQLNVGEMFNPNSDGFRGILQDDVPLYISSAVQEAWIQIDEEGAEAAAANAFVLKVRSLPLPPTDVYTFNANHPFIFYIKLHNIIIFGGVFAG